MKPVFTFLTFLFHFALKQHTGTFRQSVTVFGWMKASLLCTRRAGTDSENTFETLLLFAL